MSIITYQRACEGNAAYFEEAEIGVIRSTRDNAGGSLLSTAAKKGHLNCIQVIYKRCPELLDQISTMGVTALHEAAYYGHDDVVKFLIYARGGNVYGGGDEIVDTPLLLAKNSWKHTALHDAANKNHLQSAKWLVEADHNNQLLGMLNENGETAMDMAVRKHHSEIVELLARAEQSGQGKGLLKVVIGGGRPITIEGNAKDVTECALRIATMYKSE